MIKKVCVLGLGYQGKQYLNYFIKNNYEVLGICKTEKTKLYIEKNFGIKVSLNYRKVLDNSIDLLVLSAYPLDIYKEVISYSSNYNYKILSDLPLTFDIDFLQKNINNKKLYLMLIEKYLYFYNNFFKKNINNINYIKCLVLQNKFNLKNQFYRKESVIVDTHYVLNNILGVDLSKVDIKYKFIERSIKNIEYIIELYLLSGEKVIYKYEDGLGISFLLNNKGEIIKKYKENIIFDYFLEKILNDLELSKQFHLEKYYKNFKFILTKFDYENNF